MIQIRRLTDADGERFMDLYRTGTRDFPNGFLPSATEASTHSWDRVKTSFHALFGAFDDATLVGFCGFNTHGFERTRHRAEIGPLFVIPAHQGTPVAHDLMAALKDYARHQNIARLELYVESQNSRARAFYEKQGFQLQAILKDMVRIGDDHQDDCFYTLYL